MGTSFSRTEKQDDRRVCCLQEVRRRGQGAWDERKDISCGGLEKEIVGGVRVMVKGELCGKVVKVRKVSDRVMNVL